MAQFGRPTADISVGSWATAPLFSKLSETTPDDATTQIQSANRPTNDTFEVRLTSVTDPLSSSGHVVRIRMYGTAGHTWSAYLYQGTTLVKTLVSGAAVPSSYTTYSYTLTTGEADSITNYADLRVRIVANGAASGRDYATWIEMEFPDVIIQRSGSATISGPTHVLATIRKAAIVAAVIGILGHVLVTGEKTHYIVVSGGGAQTVVGSKDIKGAVQISGGGTVAGAGKKGAFTPQNFSDDFERADGPPGPNWEALQFAWAGPGTISSGWITGTSGLSAYPLATRRVPGKGKVIQRAVVDLTGNFGEVYITRTSPWGRDRLQIKIYRSNTLITASFNQYINMNSYLSGGFSLDGFTPSPSGDTVEVETSVTGTVLTLKIRVNGVALSPTNGVTEDITDVRVGHMERAGLWMPTTAASDRIGAYANIVQNADISGGGNIYIWSEDHSGDAAITGNGAVATAGSKGGALCLGFFDNFNRANESPIASPWLSGMERTSGSLSRARINNSVVYSSPAMGRGVERYTGVFPPDQDSQVVAATNTNFGAAVRVSSGQGYSIDAVAACGHGTPHERLMLIRYWNETLYTILADWDSYLPSWISPGHTLRLLVTGQNPVRLDVFADGVLIRTVYDSSAGRIGSGSPGFRFYTEWNGLDNWQTAYGFGCIVSGGGAIAATGFKGGKLNLAPIRYAFDDFNRAQNSPLGANWANASTVSILNNKIYNNWAAEAYPTWAGTFTDDSDQSSQITIAAVTAGWYQNVGPIVRGQTGPIRHYRYQCAFNGNTGYAGVYAVSGGTFLIGGWDDMSGLQVGDRIRLTVTGNVLRVYKNGALFKEVTDTNNRIPSGGRPGFFVGASGYTTLDDFLSEGEPPTYEIIGGGTVAATAQKTMRVAISISGGGTVYVSATENAWRAVTISGNGTVTLAGRKGGRKASPISGRGTIAAGGMTGRQTSPQVSGGGTIRVVGNGAFIDTASVAVLIRGGGDLYATGRMSALGDSYVFGGGRLTAYFDRAYPYLPQGTIPNDESLCHLVVMEMPYCGKLFGGGLTETFDNFERGDENPILPPWMPWRGGGASFGITGTPRTMSGLFTGVNVGERAAAYNVNGPWGADQYSETDGHGALTEVSFILLRVNPATSACLILIVGRTTLTFAQWVNGELYDSIVNTPAFNLMTQGTIRFWVSGSTFRVYHYNYDRSVVTLVWSSTFVNRFTSVGYTGAGVGNGAGLRVFAEHRAGYVGGCLATGTPCYNTWRTCRSIQSYSETTKAYRFVSAAYPQALPLALPYVDSVKFLPTEIKTNLTVNGRISITMLDEPDADVGTDPYWSQRASHPGTYWKRWLARNPNYKGRIVRVYTGVYGRAESTYTQRWVGKLDNIKVRGDKFTFEAVDLLKDLAKIESPIKTNAKLNLAITAQTNSTFVVTEDAAKFPATGYVRIDDEIIRYTARDATTQIFTIGGIANRAQFGTVAAAHDVKAKVQTVRHFPLMNPLETLLHMLIVDAGMASDWTILGTATNVNNNFGAAQQYVELAASQCSSWPLGTSGRPETYITLKLRNTTSGLTETVRAYRGAFIAAPTPAYRWGFMDNRRGFYGTTPIAGGIGEIQAEYGGFEYLDEAAFYYYRYWPTTDVNYTAVVSEPTKLSDLYYEIVDLIDAKTWVAENLKVTIRKNTVNTPTTGYLGLSDGDNIVFDSGAVDVNEKSRYSRVSVLWDLQPIGKFKESTDFRRMDIAIDPDVETNYGEQTELALKSRWIDPTTGVEETIQAYVKNLALRRVARTKHAQHLLSFKVAEKDSGIKTGDYVRLSTDELTEPDGNPITARMYQITKREHGEGGVLSLTGIQVMTRRMGVIAPAGHPTYPGASEAQRAYGYISNASGTMSDGTEGYFIW